MSTTISATPSPTSTLDANPVPTSVVTIGLGFIAGAFLVVTSAFFARISLARRRARMRGEPVPSFLDVFFSGGGLGGQRGGYNGRAAGGWGGMADVGFWGGGWGRSPSWAAGGRILNERMRRGGDGNAAGDVDWSTKQPPKLWEVVLPAEEEEEDVMVGRTERQSSDVAQWNPVSVARAKRIGIASSRPTPTASRRNSLTLHSVSTELEEISSVPAYNDIKLRSAAAASVPLRATVLVAMPSDPRIRSSSGAAAGGEDDEDLPDVCFGVTTIHAVLDKTTSTRDEAAAAGRLRDVKVAPAPAPAPSPSAAAATSSEKAKAEVAHVEHVEHADGTPITMTTRSTAGDGAIAGNNGADQGGTAGSGKRKGKWRI